jgi:hypothetical protein
MAVTGFQLKEKPLRILEEDIYPALEKFDPAEKFGLCEDIKKSMLYIIRQASYYCYDKGNRVARLDAIDMELAAVKMQLRIAVERKQMRERKRAQIDERLDEVGRIVGGLKRKRSAEDEAQFEAQVEKALFENFLQALVRFPRAERNCVTRATMNEFYDIARYYKGYLASGNFAYLRRLDAAVCTLMDYVNIAANRHYISRKLTLYQQESLRGIGRQIHEIKTKAQG